MRNDLNAAVTADIISADQATRLASFLDDRAQFEGGDEPELFHFVRGMHDILIALGLIFVLGGLTIVPIAGEITYTALFGIILSWALAEYFVLQKQLVLPGIVLATSVTLYSGTLLGAFFVAAIDLAEGPFAEGVPIQILVYCLSGMFAALIFFLRFWLPFALGLVAVCAAASLWCVIETLIPGITASSSDLLILLIGVLIFIFAMVEDMADPARATLRSDNAFWLHLLAAPTIIHGLIGRVSDGSLMVLVAMGLITLIALVIDRRALLVSGLGYLTFALATLMQALFASGGDDFGITLTPILVGSLVLVIGVGWTKSRRILLPLLPTALTSRIRPAVAD